MHKQSIKTLCLQNKGLWQCFMVWSSWQTAAPFQIQICVEYWLQSYFGWRCHLKRGITVQGCDVARRVICYCEGCECVVERKLHTYSNQLQVTGAKTEIGPIWGDGEVNELLLPAGSRGEVNWHHKGVSAIWKSESGFAGCHTCTGRMKVLLAHHVRCTGVDAHWSPLSRRWCCVRAANVALRSGFLCRDTVVQSLMALIRFPTRDQRLIRGGGASRHNAQCTNYQECVSDFLRRARKSDPSTTLLTASPDQVIGLFMWQGCPSSKDVVYIPDVRRLQSILKKLLCMYVFKQQ